MISQRMNSVGSYGHKLMIYWSYAAGVSLDVAAYMIGVKNDIIPYDAGRFYFSRKNAAYRCRTQAAVRLENGVGSRLHLRTATVNMSNMTCRQYTADRVIRR